MGIVGSCEVVCREWCNNQVTFIETVLLLSLFKESAMSNVKYEVFRMDVLVVF